MKDGFDVTIDVRNLLNVPAITTMLGAEGKIYQNERPSGRTAITDIVINVLGINNYEIQKGSGNINGYVPSITVGTQKMADQAKLMTLCRAIVPLIDSQYKTTFQTWIDDSPTILQDTDGTWFVNIPFEYQSIQNNYQNI